MGMDGFPSKRIDNVENARTVAEAEKPFRDAAREEGVSPEEKITLDKFAEKKGEQTISGINDAEQEKKSFEAHKVVNGVKIDAYYNGHGYEIQFPGIMLDDISSNRGVYDSVIPISESSKTAKLVFEYACKLAENESDLLKIYKDVQKFRDDLPEDEED